MAALSGELSFATAEAALEQALSAFAGGAGPVEFDLSGVTRTDSAGLALLLELARRARAAGREIRYTGAPEQVAHLARFFGVAALLGLPA